MRRRTTAQSKVDDRICNHPRAFGSSKSVRAARTRSRPLWGLNVKETIRPRTANGSGGRGFDPRLAPCPITGCPPLVPDLGLISLNCHPCIRGGPLRATRPLAPGRNAPNLMQSATFRPDHLSREGSLPEWGRLPSRLRCCGQSPVLALPACDIASAVSCSPAKVLGVPQRQDRGPNLLRGKYDHSTEPRRLCVLKQPQTRYMIIKQAMD